MSPHNHVVKGYLYFLPSPFADAQITTICIFLGPPDITR